MADDSPIDSPWVNKTQRFDQRYLRRLGLALPILQAPMAGANDAQLTIATCRAGGLGGLPAGMLSVEQLTSEFLAIREATEAPFAVNFFCHQPPAPDPQVHRSWLDRLAPYYQEYAVANVPTELVATRHPFDAQLCELMQKLQPSVVSFHYGLPDSAIVEALKKAGCLIQSSATTVAEGRWLEQHGADAIIAQGLEAGGHRGMFLPSSIHDQLGTMALLPQLVDAVQVPVIAAGGIADARGIAAALLLGACAVQLGTRYLFTQEAAISDVYRTALVSANGSDTRLTNVISGRPARGLRNRLVDELGPLSDEAPPFPLATAAIAPLRVAAETQQKGDFSPLWAGQAVALRDQDADNLEPAEELTRRLAQQAIDILGWG